MYKLKQTKVIETEVRYLKAECKVRYWEDASVNGKEDTDGDLIPMRRGDIWGPVIDLETGCILGWPAGTTAFVHYKVCDAGSYTLLDETMHPVHTIEGYVPQIMCPQVSGYGDCVIMDIDAEGRIANWRVTLKEFEE